MEDKDLYAVLVRLSILHHAVHPRRTYRATARGCTRRGSWLSARV